MYLGLFHFDHVILKGHNKDFQYIQTFFKINSPKLSR